MREIAKAIKKAENIIILPHIFPDADAMGSSFAAKELFEIMGKKCKILLQETLQPYMKICFDGEYEIFDKQKKYDADLIVCLDCGDLGRIGERAELLEKTNLCVSVDHHKTNTMYATYNYVDENAPACAILVYKLAELLNINLTQNIAKNLYTALVGDTGNFKYSNVNCETFEIAAKLISFNINHWQISKNVFDTEDINSIRLKGYLSSGLELYGDGKICVLTANKDVFLRYGISEKDIDALVDIPRRVQGVEVAVSLKETEERIKVSLRSANYVDVSKVAEVFGGGGHARAAGFVISKEQVFASDEAKKQIVNEILKLV